MKKLTGLERMLTALRIEEPDMVPHYDLVCKKVRDGILPGASLEDFIDYMDLDAVRLRRKRCPSPYRQR
jgi:hypothetical protein